MNTFTAGRLTLAKYGPHSYVERVRSIYRNKRYRIMLKEVTGPGAKEYRIRELGAGASFEEAFDVAAKNPLAIEVSLVMDKYEKDLRAKYEKEHADAISQQSDSHRTPGSGPGEQGSERQDGGQLPSGNL